MRFSSDARALLAVGFAGIVEQYRLPDSFPDEVEAAAEEAIVRERTTRSQRRDRTDLDMATLDPAESTDLDQAFCVERQGTGIVLHYAIADVAAFVDEHSILEAEAWRRGVTVYAPTNRVPVYPASISQRAASLLPDGPRPAILLSTLIDEAGAVELQSVERVIVASRAKLAYESTTAADLSPLVREFAERMNRNERTRGAARVELPRQDVIGDPIAPGSVRLVLRGESESEELNSTLSLATNLAVAQALLRLRVGLFRVMDEPDDTVTKRLRRTARALGIAWAPDEPLRAVQRRLDPNNSIHGGFLLDARRAGGKAGYATLTTGPRPWHAALAAPYAHVTAPMRRLADRYVLDLLVQLENGGQPDPAAVARLEELPEVMERSDGRAAIVDRAVIDLLEAVALVDRVGETFAATVVDANSDELTVQLAAPAVRARVRRRGSDVSEGDVVQVRLEEAEPQKRSVRFRVVEAGDSSSPDARR